MRLIVQVGPDQVVNEQVMPEVDATITVTFGSWLRWLLPILVRVRIEHAGKVTHAVTIAR